MSLILLLSTVHFMYAAGVRLRSSSASDIKTPNVKEPEPPLEDHALLNVPSFEGLNPEDKAKIVKRDYVLWNMFLEGQKLFNRSTASAVEGRMMLTYGTEFIQRVQNDIMKKGSTEKPFVAGEARDLSNVYHIVSRVSLKDQKEYVIGFLQAIETLQSMGTNNIHNEIRVLENSVEEIAKILNYILVPNFQKEAQPNEFGIAWKVMAILELHDTEKMANDDFDKNYFSNFKVVLQEMLKQDLVAIKAFSDDKPTGRSLRAVQRFLKSYDQVRGTMLYITSGHEFDPFALHKKFHELKDRSSKIESCKIRAGKKPVEKVIIEVRTYIYKGITQMDGRYMWYVYNNLLKTVVYTRAASQNEVRNIDIEALKKLSIRSDGSQLDSNSYTDSLKERAKRVDLSYMELSINNAINCKDFEESFDFELNYTDWKLLHECSETEGSLKPSLKEFRGISAAHLYRKFYTEDFFKYFDLPTVFLPTTNSEGFLNAWKLYTLAYFRADVGTWKELRNATHFDTDTFFKEKENRNEVKIDKHGGLEYRIYRFGAVCADQEGYKSLYTQILSAFEVTWTESHVAVAEATKETTRALLDSFEGGNCDCFLTIDTLKIALSDNYKRQISPLIDFEMYTSDKFSLIDYKNGKKDGIMYEDSIFNMKQMSHFGIALLGKDKGEFAHVDEKLVVYQELYQLPTILEGLYKCIYQFMGYAAQGGNDALFWVANQADGKFDEKTIKQSFAYTFDQYIAMMRFGESMIKDYVTQGVTIYDNYQMYIETLVKGDVVDQWVKKRGKPFSENDAARDMLTYGISAIAYFVKDNINRSVVFDKPYLTYPLHTHSIEMLHYTVAKASELVMNSAWDLKILQNTFNGLEKVILQEPVDISTTLIEPIFNDFKNLLVHDPSPPKKTKKGVQTETQKQQIEKFGAICKEIPVFLKGDDSFEYGEYAFSINDDTYGRNQLIKEHYFRDKMQSLLPMELLEMVAILCVFETDKSFTDYLPKIKAAFAGRQAGVTTGGRPNIRKEAVERADTLKKQEEERKQRSETA